MQHDFKELWPFEHGEFTSKITADFNRISKQKLGLLKQLSVHEHENLWKIVGRS